MLLAGAGAGPVEQPPHSSVQQRQQRLAAAMRTAGAAVAAVSAAQPLQTAYNSALQAMQRRLQAQMAANAAHAAAVREQAAAAALRSVTSAPPQFLAVVVVPEQVHPHQSAPFRARRVQVTSQQQLQHVLAQLQADFGGQMPQHQVQQLLPAPQPAQQPLQPPQPPQPAQPNVTRAQTASQQERLRQQLVDRLQQQHVNTTTTHNTGV